MGLDSTMDRICDIFPYTVSMIRTGHLSHCGLRGGQLVKRHPFEARVRVDVPLSVIQPGANPEFFTVVEITEDLKFGSVIQTMDWSDTCEMLNFVEHVHMYIYIYVHIRVL